MESVYSAPLPSLGAEPLEVKIASNSSFFTSEASADAPQWKVGCSSSTASEAAGDADHHQGGSPGGGGPGAAEEMNPALLAAKQLGFAIMAPPGLDSPAPIKLPLPGQPALKMKAAHPARTPLRSQASAYVPLTCSAAPGAASPAWCGAANNSDGREAPEKRSTVRSTVMLQMLPLSYTRDKLIDLLEAKGFAKKFNLVYVPVNFTTMLSVGYAFINMISHDQAKLFMSTFEGFNDWESFSKEPCKVCWSTVQGLAQNVRRYRNSPVMRDTVPSSYKPVLFKNGTRVPFPEPTRELRVVKQRKPKGQPEGEELDW